MALMITILTIGSFMLLFIACDRFLMFYRSEYKENNESFRRRTKLSIAGAWFIGFVLGVVQVSAGYTSPMNQQCPESLNLNESTVFVIVAIILAILTELSVIAAVILVAMVGKKLRNIRVTKNLLIEFCERPINFFFLTQSLITDMKEIKPTITSIVVTIQRVLLLTVAAIVFFVLSLSPEYQQLGWGIVDLFQIFMVVNSILTTVILTQRMKSVKKAMKNFFYCTCFMRRR